MLQTRSMTRKTLDHLIKSVAVGEALAIRLYNCGHASECGEIYSTLRDDRSCERYRDDGIIRAVDSTAMNATRIM